MSNAITSQADFNGVESFFEYLQVRQDPCIFDPGDAVPGMAECILYRPGNGTEFVLPASRNAREAYYQTANGKFDLTDADWNIFNTAVNATGNREVIEFFQRYAPKNLLES